MALKRTKIQCVRGQVTIFETDTGREYRLSVRRWKYVRPRLDVIKVPKGSRAKAYIETRSGVGGAIKALTVTDTEPEVVIPIEGGDTTPEWLGASENQVDFFYDQVPYIEVTPPGGDEDDSVIIRG